MIERPIYPKWLIPTLMLALLMASASVSKAQPRGQRMSPKDRVAKMKDQLNLTESQQSQITKIYEDADTDMKAARAKNGSGRDAMMSAMRTIMGNADARVDSVLTSDQKAKFAEMKKKRQDRTRRRSKGD